MGTTTNATDARNLYNFMDANTTRGTEFSLTGSMENWRINYSVSTSHNLLSTSFGKIGIKPSNLIFHVHNHDGPLDNGNVTGPSIEDSNAATRTVNSVGRSSSLFPRFFISLENGSMREYFHTGKRHENANMNIKTVDLRNIKKYDYFKRNR